MAEIAGMLAAGALKVAAGKLAEAAGDRLMLQWRFGEDLEDMEDTVESIQAVLQDAEGQSILNASVRLWLKRLGRASNDISDIFDEYEVKKTRKSRLKKLKVLNPCLKLAPEVGMASKMKVIREKLEKITNHHHKFTFMSSSSPNDVQQVMDARATSSDVIEANIVGRNRDKRKVMDLLMGPITSPEVIILPIYGIGGMGKTTLAQLIFNDIHFKDYKKAWVYVGQTFDSEKIVKSVESQLGNKQAQVSYTQDPGADTTSKMILIVLDDLWEKDEANLYKLKKYLKELGDGHKVHVIVTTRDGSIAEKIQTIDALKISPLSSEASWDIIKQIAGFKDKAEAEKTVLEDIGKEIAEKCGGVALAARALGYTLRFRNYAGWVSVRDSDIWKNVISSGFTASPYDKVLASLKLSYSNMPPYLRLCFAYCAIFPKGHKMSKDHLIYQWAALGFIKQFEEVSIWEHGELCITQLLEMSFFQHLKSPSSYKEYVKCFTLHDLVHDLARSVMGDELHDASRESKTGGRNCRYAFLPDCSEKLSALVMYPDKIRAARFVGSKNGHCSIGFSTANCLRVLDLGESSLNKLPSSIGQLKVLRYLDAPGIKDRVIPSCITRLSKLFYLSLRGSSEISALPESIGDMESLMYLDLSGCKGIKKLPESFGKLQNLVHLDLSHCTAITSVPGALQSLTMLQYLNLSSSTEVTKQVLIDKLIELRYLCLSSCLENDSIIDIFNRISTLPNLEHLDLSDNGSIESIPDSICSLRKLRTLDLSRCSNLKKLPETMDSMDSLRLLLVDGCKSLDMDTLPINKNLIPLPNFAVPATKGDESSKLILLKDVAPDLLTISRLENVKSAEEARIIKLSEKQSLVELTLDWTRGTQRFVEDMELLGELVPPSSLETFELHGYNSVSFPPWIMDLGTSFPNLVRVELKDLSQCTSLPPLGQLPSLEVVHLEAIPSISRIDKSFCGEVMKASNQLKKLTISNMRNLEEVMFPNAEDLTIRSCPKLRLGPCLPRMNGTLTISDSDGVLLQGEDIVDFTSSSAPVVPHTLVVESSMVPMHQWTLLHHLPGLRSLVIKKCNDLISSPEVTRALSTCLEKLTIADNLSMQQLPQWVEELVSLKVLSIDNCGITSTKYSKKDGTTLDINFLGDRPKSFEVHGLENKGNFNIQAERYMDTNGNWRQSMTTAFDNDEPSSGVTSCGTSVQWA